MNQPLPPADDVLDHEPMSGRADGTPPAPQARPGARTAERPVYESAALLATLAGASAALAACGGGTSPSDGEGGTARATGASAQAADRSVATPGANELSANGPIGQVKPTAQQAALARFLLQAQFSATPADLASVNSLGYEGWLNQQFSAPQSEGGYDWIISSGNANPFLGQFFWPNSADHMIWKQLITAPDQARMRMALALSEMFVVSTNALDAFWPGSFMGAYWDVLTKNVFGNFRALLEDVTLNPAMGRYLNMLGSLKEDAATGRMPDENYAREVMQLFTIGLSRLNLDGTPQLDSQGRPIDAYTQADVSNLARVFTGYDYDNTGVTYTLTPFEPYPVPSTEYARSPMVFDPAKHSNLAATFLGVTVPANTPGSTALRIALDTLFNHPNVGPFFAKQMIQRLVSSNPSPAYVARVATAFNNNGSGVRGDMKSFWRALLLDPEARAIQPGPASGKVREPIVRAVQWARTFKATSVDGQWKIYDQSPTDYGLGQSPLRSPSVFNFFRPGYVPPRTAIATAGLVAPEFQIHSESSTVAYLNYLADWVAGEFGYGAIRADYSDWVPLAAEPKGLVRWMNLYLTAGQLSERTLQIIMNSITSVPINATSADSVKLQRVHAAIVMVMASPEYLVQK